MKVRTSVNDGRCAICRIDRVRTGAGQLFTLAVDGPKRQYVRYICEDCCGLFNTVNWPKTRRKMTP